MDAARLTQVVAGGRRGSGYRISPTEVLTADHVVRGAESVELRFPEWTAQAVDWVGDEDTDVAVVRIEARPGDEGLARADFGGIGWSAAVLAVRAVGFPRFKLRRDGDRWFRDTHQADGRAATLSNRREGTLEITVPAPAADPDASPWEGMSGAAVWVGDRIVGVVSRHHPTDGLGRLAAVRVENARALLGLPDELPPVVRPSGGDLTMSAYRAQVADIAPTTLFDRADELAELARFCAGAEPYAWWQAPPWSGKSALMATFAANPPAGVDVVSFFVVARYAGQSDSTAYLTALIDQLTALTGEAAAPVGPSRWGEALRLLDLASARATRTGRTLVLLVDGLDEDSRAEGVPSVAALLPRRVPEGMRVVVAGRPHPDLPDDVADDHPLRTVLPRVLRPFDGAQDLERRARGDLAGVFRGGGLGRTILGLVTASGGGLRAEDLADLTGTALFDVEDHLTGAAGRVFQRWSEPEGSAYLFAHETLRDVAGTLFGAALREHADRLDAWADSYRDRGWPEDTPPYLLNAYVGRLAETGRTGRLVEMATDSLRHDRMLEVTGSDWQAQTQIAVAHQVVLRDPDPGTMLRLSVERDRLIDRNSAIMPELPVAWARLGNWRRAEALARGIADPAKRATALMSLAREAGPGERGHALADATKAVTSDPAWLGHGFAAVAMAATHRFEEARLLIESVPAFGREGPVAALARALAESGAVDEAREVLLPLRGPGPGNADQVFRDQAVALSLLGEDAQLDELAERARSQRWGDSVPAALAEIGDPRAMEVAQRSGPDAVLAVRAIEIARTTPRGAEAVEALGARSDQAILLLGDADMIVDVLERAEWPLVERLRAATALGAAGRPDAAAAHLLRAERQLRSEPENPLAIMCKVAAMARALPGEKSRLVLESVLGMLSGAPDPTAVPAVPEAVAYSAMACGHLDMVPGIVTTYRPYDRNGIWGLLALHRAAHGDVAEVMDAAVRMTSVTARVVLLARAAVVRYRGGDGDGARWLVDAASGTLGSLSTMDPEWSTAVLAVATTLAVLGETERARSLHADAAPSATRYDAEDLVHFHLAMGEWDEALAWFDAVPPDSSMDLIGLIAQHGRPDTAHRLAREVEPPFHRALALYAVAAEVPERARELVAEGLATGPWELGLPMLAEVAPDAVIALARVLIRRWGLDDPRLVEAFGPE